MLNVTAKVANSLAAWTASGFTRSPAAGPKMASKSARFVLCTALASAATASSGVEKVRPVPAAERLAGRINAKAKPNAMARQAWYTATIRVDTEDLERKCLIKVIMFAGFEVQRRRPPKERPPPPPRLNEPRWLKERSREPFPKPPNALSREPEERPPPKLFAVEEAVRF